MNDIEQLVRIQRRLSVESQSNGDRKQRAITDLFVECRNNHIVKTYIDAWIAGGFENLEMALCAMAVALSVENNRLMGYALDILNKSPKNTIVFKELK